MEKLINLLNEYEYSLFEDKSLAPQRGDIQDWVVFEKNFCEDLDKPNDLTMDVTHLISRHFGFIKWLVENNKIDDKKVPKSDYLAVQYDSLVESYKADELIMLLAISDTPIEDLVSYLK